MKLGIFLLLLSLNAFTQESPILEVELTDVDTLESAKDLGMTEEEIQIMIQKSKNDLAVEYNIEDTSLLELKSIEVKNSKCPSCNDIQNESSPKGVLFITWGYNRGFHSKSDITVETEHGKFTIKDAVGYDRPSDFSFEYLKPSKFSIPQYNLKVGYWFSEDSKFGIAGGTDHMKWVFDEQRQYDIEGYYNKPLWVRGQKLDFSEVIQGKDASFLMLEHTDGYNYPYLEGLYRDSLIKSNRIDLNIVAGAGAGILFPKTRTRIADREDTGHYRDIDNKFKVAGWGVHADLSLVLKYKRKNGMTYFLKPTARGVVGKINNALYMGSEGRISQSAIYTFEPSVSLGAEVPLSVFKRKVKNKKNNQVDEELTLEEFAKIHEKK